MMLLISYEWQKFVKEKNIEDEILLLVKLAVQMVQHGGALKMNWSLGYYYEDFWKLFGGGVQLKDLMYKNSYRN